jgi:hypothetical protein
MTSAKYVSTHAWKVVNFARVGAKSWLFQKSWKNGSEIKPNYFMLIKTQAFVEMKYI